MPLHLWWTFAAATFFISATPGPNMLHMMNSGIRHGFRFTFFTMAGCMLAVLTVTALSALGLGGLLAARPDAFAVVRVAGAAYLIYLGARTAFSSAAPLDAEITADLSARATPGEHFRSGFLVGVSNPKLLLFATAFFPQFLNESLPRLPQLALLLITFFFIELGWYMAYAAGGSRIAKYLKSPRLQRWMNRTVGTLFAGFGIALLKWRPAAL